MEDSLFLKTAPPLDPEWLKHEAEAGLNEPKPQLTPLERQPIYAQECRDLTARMMAPGARDHHLARGITTRRLSVLSSSPPSHTRSESEEDSRYEIPILQYERYEAAVTISSAPRVVVLYIHGGGLVVGEADSEELTCRRMLNEPPPPPPDSSPSSNNSNNNIVVYSVGYRLMPRYTASQSLADCLDAFDFVCGAESTPGTKLVLAGSSSGGELAALVAQTVVSRSKQDGSGSGSGSGTVSGVLLRCPVTSDAFTSPESVPPDLRALHTSAEDPSFWNVLLRPEKRAMPRDGLERMPLDAAAAADKDELKGHPKTWIQVCTNDALYSDGVCYAKVLEDAGVPVKVDVVRGWPHTFWLKAPQLQRAWEADQAMLRGLAWLVE